MRFQRNARLTMEDVNTFVKLPTGNPFAPAEKDLSRKMTGESANGLTVEMKSPNRRESSPLRNGLICIPAEPSARGTFRRP